MQEVHRYEDIILLSNKKLLKVVGSKAWFLDGSVADLENSTCMNIGSGNISFVTAELEVESLSLKSYELSHCTDLILDGGNLFFEINAGYGPGTTITLQGSDEFLASVKLQQNMGRIVITTPQSQSNIIIGEIWINGKRKKNYNDLIDGKIIITTSELSSVYIQNTGGGRGKITVPLSLLKTNITGSLNINCAIVSDVDIKITGSGNVTIKEVNKTCKILITGSGNVMIEYGDFPEIEAQVTGSGNITANVIVEEAKLIMQGSGSIVVDHVLKQSMEQHGGSGMLKVNKRG